MDHCKVCAHPQVAAISADLLAHVPYRTVEAKYSVSRSALSRHVTEHIPQALRRQAAKERYQPDGESVLAQMRKLNQRSLAILQAAEQAKDRALALGAIRECRRNLELVAKLTGELDPRAPGETPTGPLSVTVVYAERAAVLPGAPRLVEDGGDG